MKSGVRARLFELAGDRPLQAATMAAVVAATAAAASPLEPVYATRMRVMTAVQQAVPAAAPPAPTPMKLVWDGADIDGDGRADFANPTGHARRGHDAYGEGEFGASRDGGSRRHEGVDYMADAGQSVAAPISGYVTRIGFAYAGDRALKFVEVTNPALRYAVRVFYVNPQVSVGETVRMGRPIGTAHSLQRKYPGGMTDHVHLEVIDKHGRHVDSERLITAEYVPAEPAVTVAAAD